MKTSHRPVLRFACALALALGLAACGDDDNDCETAQDCPALECDDGGTLRVCVDGECQTEC